MSSNLEITAQDPVRRIQRFQAITIGWMSIEAGVSLWAAWRARSPAALAFGGDNAIELLSATLVLWRFRHQLFDERPERPAVRTQGVLLFDLTLYVMRACA